MYITRISIIILQATLTTTYKIDITGPDPIDEAQKGEATFPSTSNNQQSQDLKNPAFSTNQQEKTNYPIKRKMGKDFNCISQRKVPK